MPSIRTVILLPLLLAALVSCNGKNKAAEEPAAPAADTLSVNPNAGMNQLAAADSSLAPVKATIEKELRDWAQSFTGFQMDSFRLAQVNPFEGTPEAAPDNLPQYFELYKASLIYSPDSSQFIDLFSYGISLEKKGKKIIAIGDADQAVVLFNRASNEGKRLLSFGPSAGIEEAVWTSTSTFILAGSFTNDEGKPTPVLLLGDTQKKTLRWFESAITRPESATYRSGVMKRLKIDEWE